MWPNSPLLLRVCDLIPCMWGLGGTGLSAALANNHRVSLLPAIGSRAPGGSSSLCLPNSPLFTPAPYPGRGQTLEIAISDKTIMSGTVRSCSPGQVIICAQPCPLALPTLATLADQTDVGPELTE
jgi:hypothetical protein